MHDGERVKPRSQIIHHNARAFGQPLQLPNRKRFPDIEDTKKYKARKKGFPTERNADERNQLSGNFVNDDELWIFRAGCASGPRGGRNSNQRNNCGRNHSSPSMARDWNLKTRARPQNNRSQRSPGARPRFDTSRAEESCDYCRPNRGILPPRRGSGIGRIHQSPSSSSRLSCRTASSASATGDEITYPPLAHLPRSINRQRSLQKGKSASVACAGFLQIGQRSLIERLRGIRDRAASSNV